MDNIPLKIAVGMWTMNTWEDEIKDISDLYVPIKQYNEFMVRVKRYRNLAFSIIILDNDVLDSKFCDVGLSKINNRWIVNRIKFLKALNEKREIYKDDTRTNTIKNIIDLFVENKSHSTPRGRPSVVIQPG
jgi:hypothetical protein